MSISHLGFKLARPLLHCMDAEAAHGLTIKALKTGLAGNANPATPKNLRSSHFGLNFENPLGLAAGFDKNAEVPDAMLAQGFGFVEVGTVTPKPQAGNPKPRLFRLSEDQAVINRMGFNNEGHTAVFARLKKRRPFGIIGVNIGANKDANDRVADYVSGINAFSNCSQLFHGEHFLTQYAGPAQSSVYGGVAPASAAFERSSQEAEAPRAHAAENSTGS